MRFLENGPSIPNDLLTARDEGRVVFFCGAGVSRARAVLPDFFGLADDVIGKLGVPAESTARKILDLAREMNKRAGESGLISTDRIFGSLEHEFGPDSVEWAVAQALQPGPNVDLSAHRILLDLATTQQGKVRLVTTNFDRLFEDCNSALQVWKPSRLPNPSSPKDMDGIIHLHGRATEDYSGSEGDRFVLSSSEFGRAYLSEGWATDFFKEVIDKYVVVFVGYTADDPPVHYLLEALNKSVGQLDGVYAFEAGTSGEATARWRHKGIEAIAYEEDDGHQTLWETLGAWAERANEPEAWFKSVIDLARQGPADLQPHERGQVAHIVSTVAGARKFSEGDFPPPAEWLCVFDPFRRYDTYTSLDGVTPVEPFDLYGLDSDVVPDKIDPENPYTKRDVPATAWDGFAAIRLDRQNLGDESFSAIRGHWAVNLPRLPSRLRQIGTWIGKIAHQPASVWWAAHQIALHPDIQRQIQWELERSQKDSSPVVRKAWQHLFEAWEEKKEDLDSGWYDLKKIVDKDGWDSTAIRKFASIHRPFKTVSKNYWGGPNPPKWTDDITLSDLIHLDVEYPAFPDDVTIPDEWLSFAVQELRKNLEHALRLETELGGYGLNIDSPIVPDSEPDDDRYSRGHGLSGSVIGFSSLFARLVDLDVSAAHQEFAAWPVNDDTVFSRLRIWACGIAEVIPAQVFGPVIAGLSDNAFWDSYHQRDLLLVLSARWQELADGTRKEIEDRLLKGPAKWKDEEDAEFEERRAWSSVNRITWLANNDCKFSFNLETETNRLQAIAAQWKPEYAASAAGSLEGRSGWVTTETEHASLLEEPIRSILSKALEIRGKPENFRIERDPFAGLAAERPIRAFAALTNAARRNEYPEWAWRTFLNSEARKSDKPKFSALIGERISRHPDQALTDFIHPASQWLRDSSETLATHYPRTFDRIISKVIDMSRQHPPGKSSVIIRGNEEPDWSMEAINAPIGKIAQSLFSDPRKDGLSVGAGFPADWLGHANDLLSLPGDLRRYALVIFAHNLNWFYTIDPDWTTSSLLSALDGDDQDDRNALWSGFLWGAKTPDQKLYMRIKPRLLTLAKDPSPPQRGHVGVLAGIILAGWGSRSEETGERCVSNGEMRDVLLHANDEFRSRVLWQVARWAEEHDTRERWSEMMPELLRNVWPRQKVTKTSTISARLCDLAFSNARRFPEIAEIVLPLLTTVDRDHLTLPNLRRSGDDIIDIYPRQSLDLLHAVLPSNVAAWPYNMGETLQRIGDADDSLKLDERWLLLNQRWNSR